MQNVLNCDRETIRNNLNKCAEHNSPERLWGNALRGRGIDTHGQTLFLSFNMKTYGVSKPIKNLHWPEVQRPPISTLLELQNPEEKRSPQMIRSSVSLAKSNRNSEQTDIEPMHSQNMSNISIG